MGRLLLVNFLLLSAVLFAQGGNIIKGHIISEKGDPIQGANVSLVGKSIQTKTDEKGFYELKNVSEGQNFLRVFASGYKRITESVESNTERNFVLSADLLNIDEVVITGVRNEIPQYKSPIIVGKINSRTFETVQALSLSEGLNFSPGLRLETNCQNCGFSQVRINGLEGSYSQILINNRPIFSALVGVYGLDMIPANMIDRVEVVRGGGSSMYGGNAIAGTINILTKDPVKNYFELGTNLSFTDYKVPDKTINLNGGIVSEDLNKGISFYAYNRDRKPFDANGDGYSEVTKLQNTTWGADAFWNTSDLSKLKLNIFNITEYRRGGNKFDLANHQADITEQLDHKILGGGLSFEQYSQNYKHKFSAYVSAQDAKRDSYYGTDGKIFSIGDALEEEDVLAINAYGKSKDLSYIGGLQYSYEFNEKLIWLLGSEYNKNDVKDNMPGYERLIDQKVGTLGAYTQFEIKPTEKLDFLIGARYDNVDIKSKSKLDLDYSLGDDKKLNVFVPRITAMYSVTDFLKARASFSQGYRAPQAFDEDLHTDIAGGDIIFTKLDNNLKVERSNSVNTSLNFTKNIGEVQANIVLEGFYTKLNDAFAQGKNETINVNGKDVEIVTKRNSEGATVSGLNFESSFAFSRKINFQIGATIQNSKYKEEEKIWEDEDDSSHFTATKVVLRTPNSYGYYTLDYSPISELKFSLSGVYTGKMDVPHVKEYNVGTNDTKKFIEKTRSFFENHFKVSYDLDIKDNCINIYTGIQNMFNEYQKDLDTGKDRDSDYVYGPSRPRTIFFGIKYKF